MGAVQVVALVVGILAVTAAGLLAVFYPVLIRPQRRIKALIARGTSATAVVRSFHSTGVRSNGRVMFRLELDVTTPDGAIVPAVTRSMLDVTYGRMRQGMVLPVRLDPADPTQVAIDWAAWTSDPDGDGRS